MAEKKGIPLSEIDGFSPEVTQALAGLWITTAEELVAAASRPGGVEGLAEYLKLSTGDVVQLVDRAQAALPPGVSFSVENEPTYGLGALDEPRDGEGQGSPRMSFAPLPPRVDLHENMPPIRNQGQRGTCVAFATTAVREYLLCPTPQANTDLSEQFLYWNCKKHDLYPGEGTFINIAMDRLVNDGECTETDWPYNPVVIHGNEGQDPPPPTALGAAAPFKISKTSQLAARSVDDLRQALADGSPIAFATTVYNYWFGATTGDIRLPLPNDPVAGGHAMCMVGYEDDPSVPGGGYFMIRNSWGTNWAAQSSIAPGYARLPYAYMEKFGNAAHIALITQPKPEPSPTSEGFFDLLLKFLKRLFGG
ncbi:MAG TPA: C1 family peptidase [Anaerolineaceae bacterium]|nr:C1 family peptidase [Anaerolineaceae bacterium]